MIVACIPAFNEEKNIGAVIVQAKRYVDRVIVCDDGSSDLTAEISEGLGAIVIRHGKNGGYGAVREACEWILKRQGAWPKNGFTEQSGG